MSAAGIGRNKSTSTQRLRVGNKKPTRKKEKNQKKNRTKQKKKEKSEETKKTNKTKGNAGAAHTLFQPMAAGAQLLTRMWDTMVNGLNKK